MRSAIIGAALLLSAAALLAPAQVSAQDAETKASKPNIIVIWGDDIGQGNISAYTKGLTTGISWPCGTRTGRSCSWSSGLTAR